MKQVKYLIIGAGPTGLGAGHRLNELDEKDFLILESNEYVGGLAASFEDKQGFTWDVGGHVIFSHYDYFDRLLEDLLGEETVEHWRKALIRIVDTWVPYPFQNNIRHLPKHLAWECVKGLLNRNHKTREKNFEQWVEHVFGLGLARLFFKPYNFKVWAVPLRIMDKQWIAERVSLVDVEGVLEKIIMGEDDSSWGPNNTFKYPLKGGTGEIFRRLAARIPGHIQTKEKAARIDPKNRILTSESGSRYKFQYLLNTAPLDKLILETIAPEDSAPLSAAQGLKHNGVVINGIGFNAARQDDTCWMYFPESNCPFYRVTNFHKYSPNNTANPTGQTALMTETSFSDYEQKNLGGATDSCIQGLLNTKLMSEDELKKVETTWEMEVQYAYPIPCLQRNASLRILQPYLEEKHIYARGRFGGWKYEVGNMDHSVMQGVEWADRMILGTQETTYHVG
jgi:protoporphyrinogen oxidase